MSVNARSLAASLFLIIGAADCATAPDRIISSPVAIRARRDDGLPVAGVTVRINDIALGQTDDRGLINALLSGPDGALFHVQAACPEGFNTPAELPPIVLGKFASLTQRDGSLDLTIDCERQRRTAAILVRARVEERRVVTAHPGRSGKRIESSQGVRPVSGLSVMINGRERARTDANGLAHLSLEGAPGTHVEVGLQTAGQAFANLSPHSPAQGLSLHGTDDFYTVDQMFTDEHVIVRKPAPVLVKPQTIRVFDGGDDTPALVHFK